MARPIFLNHYDCPRCRTKWEDEWCATCDDDCPACGYRHISPTENEDTGGVCDLLIAFQIRMQRNQCSAFRAEMENELLSGTAGSLKMKCPQPCRKADCGPLSTPFTIHKLRRDSLNIGKVGLQTSLSSQCYEETDAISCRSNVKSIVKYGIASTRSMSSRTVAIAIAALCRILSRKSC